MVLFWVVIYFIGESNGSNDTGNPMVWVLMSMLVSIPASFGAAGLVAHKLEAAQLTSPRRYDNDPE
jgi:hypothetical protein